MTFAVTRRMMTLGLAVAFAGVLAVTNASWVLAVPVVPLVGVAAVALVEAALPMPRQASFAVDAPPRLLKDDVVRVRVRARQVALPHNLAVEPTLPDGWTVEPGSATPFRPVAGDPGWMEATVDVRAGRHGVAEVPSVRLVRQATLGLAARTVAVGEAMQATVLPLTAAQRRSRVRPRPPNRSGLATRVARLGPGDEFYALREYVPGDEMGRINWRATARHGRPITNEVLPDEPPRYVLYVDTRSAASERGTHDAFDRTIEAAATLAEALVAARAHVGLVLIAWESRYQLPGGGTAHAQRLRRLLLECRPGADGPLEQLLRTTLGLLPGRASAILLTPNVYDPTLPASLLALRTRHRYVSLLAPAFPEPHGASQPAVARRIAGTMLNADQTAVLAELGRYADAVVQWLPDEPIPTVWARLGLAGRSR